ncbi:MAG: ATP-binding protein, partial [Armatimonadota bacterium]
ELNTSFKEMLQEIASAERQLVETGQRLAKAEKLAGIGLMTAGVAHEINNPLAAVAIAAESLDLPGIKPEHRHRLATSIMEGTKRIQSIVTELLTLDPTRTIDRKSTAVRDVIDDVLSKLEIPSTISIDYRLEENLPSIRADRDSLSRALGNIFKNAIQAMNKGGILTISAEPIGSGMIITIEDTGYGMDIEQVERIFDPFYTTREVGFGFGLGLSFAHAVVKQHGGDILVRSEPGQGTVFMVALPLDEKDAVKQSDWLSRVPSLERESKDA